MNATSIVDTLRGILPGVMVEAGAATDQPTVYVRREQLASIAEVLRDHPALQFRFLADVTAVDWHPREPRFEVVYHMVSLGPFGPRATVPQAAALPGPGRLRVKVAVPGADPHVPTVSGIWPSADWPEREVWDLFGIVFEGHPELHRLLTPDDWEGHPLRKDYPVQVRVPVNTQSALQLTTEEFVANIERRRAVSRER